MQKIPEATHASATATETASREFYDRLFGGDEYTVPLGDSLKAVIQDVRDRLGSPLHALDVGAGRCWIQRLWPDTIALDIFGTSLRRHSVGAAVVGTATDLPFRDDSLDLIMSVDALEHVPELGRAFDEIDRCLRPGGIAVLAPSWHVPWYHGPGYCFRSWREVAVRNWVNKAVAHVLARVSLLRRACIIAGRFGFVHRWWSDRTSLSWKRLRACYEMGLKGYIADSDATAFLDSFAAIVYFRSRGYRQFRPRASLCASLFAGHIELIVQKPLKFTA